MEEVTRRIQELKELEGLNNKEFAERIDVSPAIISHVISGRNNPSLNLIHSILKSFTNVNSRYLLTGEGALLREDTNVNESNSPPSSDLFNEGVRVVSPPGSTPLSHPAEAEQEKAEDHDKELHSAKESKGKTEKSAQSPPSSQESDKKIPDTHSPDNEYEERKLERIVFFYSDRSFEEYRP